MAISGRFRLAKTLTVPYAWEHGRDYLFEVMARGTNLEFAIDGQKIIQYDDHKFAYGMFGFSKLSMGRTYFGTVMVEDL